SIPSSAEIARAEKFVRDRFVHEGEAAATALAPGSARRRALDLALAELDADPRARGPSTAWRREFSLLLGLERLLSEDEPKLADGTVLSAHQVDALSGTLTALLAAAQSAAPNGNGRAAASASPELLATADILGPDDRDGGGALAVADAAPGAGDEDGVLQADYEDEPEPEGAEEDSDIAEDDDLGTLLKVPPAEDEEDEDEGEFEENGLSAELREGEEQQELERELAEEPREWVEEE